MPVSTAQQVATDISQGSGSVRILWHGGEPLSCGIYHFESLLKVFEYLRVNGSVYHSLQTNATLITKEWCNLLTHYSIHTSISIDGPEWANADRKNWANRPSYREVLQGIDCLHENNIKFSAICVVTEKTIHCAHELFNFFCDLGCSEVGFNIQEQQGVFHERGPDDNFKVSKFWKELFLAWKERPVIKIRELDRALKWIQNPEAAEPANLLADIFPSIAYNGKVVVISPEFLDASSMLYADFEVGNVLNEPLSSICLRASENMYVKDYLKGVHDCRQTCEYYVFCQGGQASNKYFELGTTAGTETVHCRNSEQRLIDSILEVV